MDSQLHSNGSNARPADPPATRPGARSKVAARVERVLNTALAGERAAVLNVAASEVMGDSVAVAAAMHAALSRRGAGLMGHWLGLELLRRSAVHDDLLNALVSTNPLNRAAAARVCGAARMTDAVVWIADLLRDPNPHVRDAAVRSLSQLGGRRAVEALMDGSDAIPLYRLAIAIARAASDVDIEALMRKPASETAAVATVLACGLRSDVLRVSPLLGIAHDRRWPRRVRVSACKSLAAIGDRAAADGLKRLALSDPDETVRTAAERAHRRLVKRAVASR